MPKTVIPARTISNAVDQWEVVQEVHDIGVSVTYHRRMVTRDGSGNVVGTVGPLVATTVQWADLPNNIRNALTLSAGHGDTL